MREFVCQSLFKYWNEVRRNRVAPLRFDIEPARISPILPDTFILERADHSSTRFRLAGTRICEAFDTEFRGREIFDVFNASDRETLHQQIAVIVRQGAVGYTTLKATTARGNTADFDMVLLPLIHAHNTIDRFIGALGPVGLYPWLGTEPLLTPAITSHELIWPDGRPHAVIEQGRIQSPFSPDLPVARIVRANRRQFRVYEGGLEKLGKS